MTANMVQGFGQISAGVPKVSNAAKSQEDSGFMDVLKESTAKNDADLGSGNDDKLKKTAAEVAAQSDKPVDKTEKTGKADDAAKEVDAKDETEAIEETKAADIEATEEPDAEEMKAVLEALASVVQSIADTLNVPVEAVNESIENLNLDVTDVLDTKNIPLIVADVNHLSDVSEIMMDENLSADVKELIGEVNETLDGLAREIGSTVEELKADIDRFAGERMSTDYSNRPYNESETVTENRIDSAANPTPVIEVEGKNNTGDDTQGRAKSDGDSGNNNTLNFAQTVIDNLKAVTEARVNENTSDFGRTISAQDIYEQVMSNLKLTMKADMTQMEMELHPASLGNVRVQVAAKDGVITASFTTENESVKAALETQVLTLKNQLEEQGIKVEAVEVTVGSHAFERNLSENGEGSGNPEGENNKSKPRSIDLSRLSEDDIESLGDEDRVTADMMAREGNTVNYLA